MVESTLDFRESIQMPNRHLNPILLLYIVLGFDDFWQFKLWILWQFKPLELLVRMCLSIYCYVVFGKE